MKIEWKKKWLKALRRGKYKQGRLALRRRSNGGYEYCCLGVLCNIVDPKAWRQWEETFTHNRESYIHLSTKVMKIVGLGSNDPMLTKPVSCMIANDMRKMTFKQIADLIQQSIPGE